MSKVRSVAGGGRAVEVEPERLAGWFDRFVAQHGGTTGTVVSPELVVVRTVDGATATAQVPFGPLTDGLGESPVLAVESLVAHVNTSRRIGLLLVRLGGHSMGVAQDGRVVLSSTDRRQVHGRNKAGGWSQQRFARRREGQARVALQAAAEDVVRVLVPLADSLDALVLGGDRRALETLRADRRLTALLDRAEPRVLDVPEPRRTVLDDAAVRARAVEVVVQSRS
jgi:Actinobacteria/chloroflexi VLRF1 release factor